VLTKDGYQNKEDDAKGSHCAHLVGVPSRSLVIDSVTMGVGV
jgi:hypothetical protein